MKRFLELKENIPLSSNVENMVEKSIICCQNSNDDFLIILISIIPSIISIFIAIYFSRQTKVEIAKNLKLLQEQKERDIKEQEKRYLHKKNGLKGIINNLKLLGLHLNAINEQIINSNIDELLRNSNLNLALTIANGDIQAYLRMLDRHYVYLDLHESSPTDSLFNIDYENHQLLVNFQNLTFSTTSINLIKINSLLKSIENYFLFHLNKYPDIKKELEYLLSDNY